MTEARYDSPTESPGRLSVLRTAVTLSEIELCALCELLLKADPWPLDEANYQVLSDLANRTAQQMGYDDCFEACTRLKGAGWLMPD